MARRRREGIALACGAALLLFGCTDGARTGPCARGICVADAGGARDSSQPSGDGAVRRDGSGPATDGATSPADGPPSCQPSWSCGSWETDGVSDEAQQRCVDTTGCVAQPKINKLTLPQLDLEYFKCKVQPVLAAKCSMMACHGTDTGRPLRVFARGRWRNKETVPQVSSCLPPGKPMDLQQEGSGTIMCLGWSKLTATEWRRNHDSARAFMAGLTPAQADTSELLTQAVVGGLPHVGVHLYRSTDTDYLTIRSWLSGAKLGTVCNTGDN